MADEVRITPGVKFPDKFRSPVVMLEVPVGTKEGDEVVASNHEGRPYGPYRVARTLEPGEGAIITFAMCYKVVKDRATTKRTSATSAVADALLQQSAVNAAILAELAELRKAAQAKGK